MGNSLKTVGAACLAVGLISTWDSPAQASPAPISFSGAITPNENLYDVYFLFAGGPCAPAYSKLISDFIPANATTSFNITFNSIFSNDSEGDPYIGNYFTVIGLYDPVNGGVSLGFNPTQGSNILTQSTPPAFDGPWTVGYGPNAGFHPSGVQESVVASALESGTYNGQSLDDSRSGGIQIDPNSDTWFFGPTPNTPYYSQVSTDPNNPSDFTLVDFSGASAGGSGYAVEVVPEPATISLIALSLGSCLWLRRRNSA